MELIRLGLQFFAEGGAAGTAAAAPAAPAGEGAVAAPTGEQNATPPVAEEPDIDRQFSDDIRGKYKDQFGRAVADVVTKRLKSAKTENARLAEEKAQLQEFVDSLLDDFDADDIDGLKKKLAEDRSRRVDDLAIKEGTSTEEADAKMKARTELRRTQRENAAMKAERQAQQEEAQRTAARERIFNDWKAQVERDRLAEVFPGFDLESEIANNETFATLLINGVGKVSVRDAYLAAHGEEAYSQAMQYAAKQGTAVAAARFADNAKRPQEGPLAKTAPGLTATDVRSLTKAQRQEIIKRVSKGEIIRF